MAFLLASATALLTAAPTLYEALWPLAWVALVPLFLALRGASPKRALLLGWWAETLMYWLGFYWLIGTMVYFGFIPLPLSVCFFALIGLGNGIRLGLFACWLRWMERLAKVPGLKPTIVPDPTDNPLDRLKLENRVLRDVAQGKA
jgi:apolipoprotein N-acyltransferase